MIVEASYQDCAAAAQIQAVKFDIFANLQTP
jgi:hypothetical protein